MPFHLWSYKSVFFIFSFALTILRSNAAAEAPESHVLPLAPLSGRTFAVAWTIDNGELATNVANFDIYVSSNGMDYAIWLSQTKAFSAAFTGVPGTTYSFFSVARDLSSMLEPQPATADAQTTVSSNGPILMPVPDQVAAVDATLALTNIVTGDAPGPFRFRLESGAPVGARVNATDGIFQWKAFCRHGGSTNRIMVWVVDTSTTNELSDAIVFNVRVGPCVEAALGAAVVQAGALGQVPLTIFSSSPVTQLTFQVSFPAGLLTNFALGPQFPGLCSSSIQPIDNSNLLVHLNTCQNQPLQQTQQVALFRARAVAGQPSSFLPLVVGQTDARTATGETLSRPSGDSGRLAVIGTQPLLDIARSTGPEPTVSYYGSGGVNFRVEQSSTADGWHGLVTGLSDGIESYSDGAAPFLPIRTYRGVQLVGTTNLTGDHLVTTNGEVIIHPVNHASLVMSWNGRMIYVDPVGAASLYTGFPRADLILVTHTHSDHFSSSTLTSVTGATARIVAPQAVFNSMSASLRNITTVLANGASTSVMNVTVDAVPAYNSNHALGAGNGYVLTIGGRRIYFSGDTGNVPEIRALQNIDVAFLCMNLPFTMSVTDAAQVTRAMRPKVIYPYHYRNSDGSFADFNSFKAQVGQDLPIEIRLRNWY